MSDMSDMREVWKKFRDGDHVTNKELQAMRKQITDALPFLQSFPEGGAVRKVVIQDLNSIDHYIRARKEDSPFRAPILKGRG